MTMYALTLRDPWATLVAIGAKRIETRSWRTHYRGPLAIHAAKCLAPADWAAVSERPEVARALRGAGIASLDERPRGAIIAIAELVAVLPTEEIVAAADQYLLGDERHFGDYAPGRFGWLLVNVKPLSAPIPARGALGLWTTGDGVDTATQ